MKNSDETDKLSAKNMLLTLKSEKMKFGMRESKHAMMFGGTSSLKKKRICSKFYVHHGQKNAKIFPMSQNECITVLCFTRS